MAADRIDIHHHVIPDLYLEAMKRSGRTVPLAGIDYPTWEVETDLDVLDRNGIRTAVVSVTAPGVEFVTGAEAVRLVRETNEFMAQLVADHPKRYGAFALMPLPDVSSTLDEIDFAIRTPGLDGVGLFSNYGGVYPGDPAFEPVFARLAESRIPVFLHPTIPSATDQPGFDLPPSLYEFPFDTTRAVVSLLYSGTLDRHPDLRLIVAHAGGTIPYLAHRLTQAATISSATRGREPKDLIGSLRRLYYDTAMSANPYTLTGLTSLIGSDRILFGTDYPFMPEQTSAESVRGVSAFFAGDGLRNVERRNALSLLPGLAERYAAG